MTSTHLSSLESFIPSLILTEPSERLFCSRCAQHSIPLPPGATQKTTFTCCACCDRLLTERDPEITSAVTEIAAQIDAQFTREGFAGASGDISTGRNA